MHVAKFAIALAGLALLPQWCLAQTSPAPPGTVEENKPSEKTPDVQNREQPLSEKLKENEGVLKPPPTVDPEIAKPVPNAPEPKTPVIIPPGEPGGDQSIQPK